MTTRQFLGLAFVLAAGCTSSENISDFHYVSSTAGPGAGSNGVALPEGGEIRHENVRLLGNQVEWLMVYQYSAASGTMSAPFAPITGGGSDFGPCVDERQYNTWPFTPITGATYMHTPTVPTLTGTGITGSLPITESTPPNTVGNSTLRSYGFTYGGGAPGATGTFNDTLTAGQATGGGTYTLDIGENFTPGALNEGSNLTYTFAQPFTAPLGIGGSATVMIPTSQDLTVTWTAPKNDLGSNGVTHEPDTYVNFMLFVESTASGGLAPQFICFMDLLKPGTLTVPKAVLSQLATSGLVVDADMTHYMAEATNPMDPNGSATPRRFDIVTIWCNISQYSLQQ